MNWKDALRMFFWLWPMTPEKVEPCPMPEVQSEHEVDQPMRFSGLGGKADGFAALAAYVLCSNWGNGPREPRNVVLVVERNDGTSSFQTLRRDDLDHVQRVLDWAKAGLAE